MCLLYNTSTTAIIFSDSLLRLKVKINLSLYCTDFVQKKHKRFTSILTSGFESETKIYFPFNLVLTMEATRYMSPINPAVFPYLTTVLLAIGTFFTAWFFVFEGRNLTCYPNDQFGKCFSFTVSRPKKGGKESVIFKELLLSLFAALFLGFGVLFLLLSIGIYV